LIARLFGRIINIVHGCAEPFPSVAIRLASVLPGLLLDNERGNQSNPFAAP
jgi:hypothetical protein